jgi:hypothetical protein
MLPTKAAKFFKYLLQVGWRDARAIVFNFDHDLAGSCIGTERR